jgi:hypothetical protein
MSNAIVYRHSVIIRGGGTPSHDENMAVIDIIDIIALNEGYKLYKYVRLKCDGNIIFRDITSCGPLKISRCFE